MLNLNNENFHIVNGILTEYKGSGGDVVIPDSVTAIGSSAFWDCFSLTSATYKGVTYSYENISDLYKAINGD